jgi:hypothetical protein
VVVRCLDIYRSFVFFLYEKVSQNVSVARLSSRLAPLLVRAMPKIHGNLRNRFKKKHHAAASCPPTHPTNLTRRATHPSLATKPLPRLRRRRASSWVAAAAAALGVTGKRKQSGVAICGGGADRRLRQLVFVCMGCPGSQVCSVWEHRSKDYRELCHY